MKDTTGLELKRALGLEDIRYVAMSRVLISTYKVYYVFYDTRRVSTPITNQRALRGNMPTTTPLIDIKDFNGVLRGSMFFTIDLAGQYSNQKLLTHTLESGTKATRPCFLGSLKEYITIADLKGDQGMSDFTKNTRKQRNKAVGAESRVAKLVDLDINKPEGHITFKWLTPTTEPIYAPDYKFQSVDSNSLSMTGNSSKTYELWIRVLNFFEWLSVFEGEAVRNQEIKEIFEISNVQVWSDDPSFQYQSANYNLSVLGGSIFKTTIAPKKWNAPHLHGDGNMFVSKHLGGLIANIRFWFNPMASMMNKYLISASLRTLIASFLFLKYPK